MYSFGALLSISSHLGQRLWEALGINVNVCLVSLKTFWFDKVCIDQHPFCHFVFYASKNEGMFVAGVLRGRPRS